MTSGPLHLGSQWVPHSRNSSSLGHCGVGTAKHGKVVLFIPSLRISKECKADFEDNAMGLCNGHSSYRQIRPCNVERIVIIKTLNIRSLLQGRKFQGLTVAKASVHTDSSRIPRIPLFALANVEQTQFGADRRLWSSACRLAESAALPENLAVGATEWWWSCKAEKRC